MQGLLPGPSLRVASSRPTPCASRTSPHAGDRPRLACRASADGNPLQAELELGAEEGEEAPDSRLGSDFRRLVRLRDAADGKAAAPRAPGAVAAASGGDASQRGGLDRLMQAARDRKKLAEQAPSASTEHSSGAAARVPWRSRLSAAAVPGLDQPARRVWDLRLTLAAKARDAPRTRALLADMAVAGLLPGPREYHAAAAACVLEGDVGGALRIMQDQHARGGRALFETYTAVIRASAVARLPDLATEAQEAATRAGYDDMTSWRLLCDSLFAAGASVEAFQAVERGKGKGYVPGESTALYMLRFMADVGLQPEATLLWDQFREAGLKLGHAHHNAFMEAMIYSFGKRDVLQMQVLGTAFPSLDTAGVNMALAAMRSHPSQLGDTGEAWNPSVLLRTLDSSLAEHGCVPDALTHVLTVQVATIIGEMETAVAHFHRLGNSPEAGSSRGTALLPADSLVALLRRLSQQGRGEALLGVLSACVADGMRLPLDALAPDQHGRTLASQWLARERALSLDVELLNQRTTRDARTVAKEELREQRVWRGPRLVFTPLSKMKVADLRAEAVALGLLDVGTRKELNERVRMARAEVKDGVASPEMLAAAAALYKVDLGDEAPPPPPARSRTTRQVSYVGPLLQRISSWRDAPLEPRSALALGCALCTVLQQAGAMVTQADLVCLAREAPAAQEPEVALMLLHAAADTPDGASLQLYVLAAEACAAVGDAEGALRCIDEADLAGWEVEGEVLARVLEGVSAVDDVFLDPSLAETGVPAVPDIVLN